MKNDFAFMIYIVDFLFGFNAGCVAFFFPSLASVIIVIAILVIGLIVHTYMRIYEEKAFRSEQRKARRR